MWLAKWSGQNSPLALAFISQLSPLFPTLWIKSKITYVTKATYTNRYYCPFFYEWHNHANSTDQQLKCIVA